MSGLVEFLLARIAEDERAANLCIHPYGEGVTPPTPYESHANWPQGETWYDDGWSSDEAPHLSRWSPARALAECETKKRIVNAHEWDETPGSPVTWSNELRSLASVYADHEDYREEWKP